MSIIKERLSHSEMFLAQAAHTTFTCNCPSGQENTRQARAFLERHPEFAAMDAMATATVRLPALAPAMRPDGNGGLLLTPARTATDGFFLALFERRA